VIETASGMGDSHDLENLTSLALDNAEADVQLRLLPVDGRCWVELRFSHSVAGSL
jgi:hypothetical protein